MHPLLYESPHDTSHHGQTDLDRGGILQSATMMYYPFVHPPRLVLWQALLYWDELTSISPEDGYRFGRDLMELRDLGLYRPSHADDLPQRARADLISDLFQVVEGTPGEELVPVPGSLTPDNRLYWGKLPYMVEQDLVGSAPLYRSMACCVPRRRCCHNS